MSTKTIPSVFCAITFIVALLCEPIIAQNGNCDIEGVDDLDWFLSKDFTVLDTNTDNIFDETATNVIAIKSVTQSDNVNSYQLYMKAEIIGSKFVVSPTELFAKYEEQETSRSFGLSVEFTCEIQTKKLLIMFNIKDTNNHYPEFLPGNNYEYKILTPMPAGIPISTFYGAIKVRDYDLTTKSITFGIEENDYLEMVYDSVDDTKKVHTGILKSIKAILRLDDPLVLRISATDVDDTGDEPKTSYATITITSDPLAQPPQFSSIYYTGSIEDGHLTMDDQIEISVGYSNDVVLTVSNDEYFSVTNDGSIITISIKGVIPEEVLADKNHFLFSLFAAKDNTEGGSAAIYISISKAQDGICDIEGINNDDWTYSKNFNVLDTNTENIFEGTATNVMGVNVTQSASLNSENLYLAPVLVGSKFILTPTQLFAKYRELETMLSYGMMVDFTCGSQTRRLIILVTILDGNNHFPQFLPGNNYQYKILTSMPPAAVAVGDFL